MNNTTNAFFTRRRRPGHGHGHTQRRNARHRPRPLPLLEAIDGLSQALADLRTSLGIAQSSRTDRLAWPQQQPQQAIAMPWLSDSQAPETPQTSTEQDPDWSDDLWSCPWDELSVRELWMLLRCYPIDRRSLPVPIENLRRSELIEALSQLQEITT
jgi:hypothetical protein